MRLLLFSACAALLLSSCLSVYKMEVQQGNVVTQEMIDKLQPGMTRSQVRFVLGSPMITDAFHPERWDYYYFLRRTNEETGEARQLTVIFKKDALVSIIKKNESAKPEVARR